MARHAPAEPSTETLQGLYALNEVAELGVDIARQRTGGILIGDEPGLFGVVGACAPTANAIGIIRREGAERTRTTETEEGLWLAGRINVWKPRSDPDAWHGLETDDPELAYRLLAQEAIWSSGVAMEVNWLNGDHTETHVDRYGSLLTLAWIGARAIDDVELMKRSALASKELPLAIKNGLDGELGPALERIDMLTDLRGDGAAPVVLLYRGGENAKNPQLWERQYRTAIELTGGQMIADGAHGAEMAFDPVEQFKKSEEGQLRALARIQELAAQGEMPNGLMLEASAIVSPVDPNIPHQFALDALVNLNAMRHSRQLVSGVTS